MGPTLEGSNLMLKSMVHFEGWCRKKGALFSVSYIMTPEKAQTIHETSILCTSFDPIKNQPFIWGKYTCPMDDIREVSLMFFELYFLRVSNLGQTPAPRGSKLMKFFSVTSSFVTVFGHPEDLEVRKVFNLLKKRHVNSPSPTRRP